ncbi:Protein TANC1 [Sesbania bispinosa]|nr:Protein TANC1 [Sesbania bispinosa]
MASNLTKMLSKTLIRTTQIPRNIHSPWKFRKPPYLALPRFPRELHLILRGNNNLGKEPEETHLGSFLPGNIYE